MRYRITCIIIIYFSVEYSVKLDGISDARASVIQKCKDLPILSKLDFLQRSPVKVRLGIGELFLNLQESQYVWRKVYRPTSDQRIP